MLYTAKTVSLRMLCETQYRVIGQFTTLAFQYISIPVYSYISVSVSKYISIPVYQYNTDIVNECTSQVEHQCSIHVEHQLYRGLHSTVRHTVLCMTQHRATHSTVCDTAKKNSLV